MSVSRPLVSVIIPAYNASATLGRALSSVFRQTYRPLEIVVVDDGSTDETPELIEKMGDQVAVIRQENQGVSVARNAGILATQGELIAFLDADDEWLPHKVARQVEFLEANPDVSLVYTRLVRVDRDGGEGAILPREMRGDTYPNLFHSNCILTSSVIVRRSSLQRVGLFDVRLRNTQDYDLWLRIAANGHFAGLPEPLVRYWDLETGLSRNIERRYRAHLDILARTPARPELGVDRIACERAAAHYHFRLGRLMLRAGRYQAAAQEFASVLAKPWRYGWRRSGPADHRVKYLRAFRSYSVCRLKVLATKVWWRKGGQVRCRAAFRPLPMRADEGVARREREQ